MAAKLKQEDVATEFARTRQAISSWETGKTQPDLMELRELCLLYGVSPDKILMGVDDSALEGRLLLSRLRGVQRPDLLPSVED